MAPERERREEILIMVIARLLSRRQNDEVYLETYFKTRLRDRHKDADVHKSRI